MPLTRYGCNRRHFLMQASAVPLAAMYSRVLEAQDLAPYQAISSDTPLKFNPDGTPRAFAGNTVVCHLPAQCAVRDAVTALHDDLMAAPFRDKLGLTPPDSYHMTVFSGATDQERTATGWPSYVAKDATVEICNREVGERMQRAHLDCELPLRLRFDEAKTLKYPTACSLRLVPADEREKKKLQSIRNQLADVYQFRAIDFARYEFHLTVAYQLKAFVSQERSKYMEILSKHISRIANEAPVVEFGNPEFCTFKDMFYFSVKKMIACS